MSKCESIGNPPGVGPVTCQLEEGHSGDHSAWQYPATRGGQQSRWENTDGGKWRFIFTDGSIVEQELTRRSGADYPRWKRSEVGIHFTWASGHEEMYIWANMAQAGYWPPKEESNGKRA